MKENLAPSPVAGEYKTSICSRTNGKGREEVLSRKAVKEGTKQASTIDVCSQEGRSLCERACDVNKMEVSRILTFLHEMMSCKCIERVFLLVESVTSLSMVKRDRIF